MPGWSLWLLLGFLGWAVVAIAVVRFFAVARTRSEAVQPARPQQTPGVAEARAPPRLREASRLEERRILVVDDDLGLRLLLRTTLAADEYAVQEAASAEDAADLARFWSPAIVILDIGLPGMDGLTFCRTLKHNPVFGAPLVVLLTGAESTVEEVALAGPDAVLRKPFSPLELIALLDRLTESGREPVVRPAAPEGEQLLTYARDLSRLLEVERAQRRLLQSAYRQTATALADALEAKDPVTGLHALRVQRYALELTEAVEPSLLDDASLEYGFLLHDVGKIGIPDSILLKAGSLSDVERGVMQSHTLVGAQLLSDVVLLQGEGLRVVRSHHERWDGKGYPDGLVRSQIPLGARIFALVDALDAMTSDRPYRSPLVWERATDEIVLQTGGQFDPRVVDAFAAREGRMHRIAEELAESAA
jgi:response regulator RpfG family c-di-GMP phosphodiesterase